MGDTSTKRRQGPFKFKAKKDGPEEPWKTAGETRPFFLGGLGGKGEREADRSPEKRPDDGLFE
jgi:hypothetical protein